MTLTSLLPKKWANARESRELSLPARKRIQTPAGARLSNVLNAETHLPSLKRPKTPKTPKSPLTLAKDAGAVIITREVDVESFRQSQRRATLNIQASMSPSFPETRSVFSEEKLLFPPDDTEEPKRSWTRGALVLPLSIADFKKRKVLWVVALGVLVILALTIGLTVGLTRRPTHSQKSTTSPSGSTSGGGATTTSSPSPVATTSVALSAGFPVGTWSVFTFLDTVLTNCTSNPTTWTCAPGYTYQQDADAGLTTFNFEVKNGSTAGSYTIAPTTTGPSSMVMSDISFAPIPLELVDAGQPSENYRFQIQMNKVDSISSVALSEHTAGAATCFFNSTTFQGYLYTKMASTYPSNDQSLPANANAQWPFAAKMEQVVGGGPNTPSCWTEDPGGRLGTNVTVDLTEMPAGDLCSCLYINYDT